MTFYNIKKMQMWEICLDSTETTSLKWSLLLVMISMPVYIFNFKINFLIIIWIVSYYENSAHFFFFQIIYYYLWFMLLK